MSDEGEAAGADEEKVPVGESGQVLIEAFCDRKQYILGLFAFAVVFLVLQVPYVFVLEPGSTLFVVSVMNVIGSTVFAAGFGAILWVCRQRTP